MLWSTMLLIYVISWGRAAQNVAGWKKGERGHFFVRNFLRYRHRLLVLYNISQRFSSYLAGGPWKLHHDVLVLYFIFHTRCYRWYSDHKDISYEFNDSFSFCRSDNYFWSVCIIEIFKFDFGILLPNCNFCDLSSYPKTSTYVGWVNWYKTK